MPASGQSSTGLLRPLRGRLLPFFEHGALRAPEWLKLGGYLSVRFGFVGWESGRSDGDRTRAQIARSQSIEQTPSHEADIAQELALSIRVAEPGERILDAFRNLRRTKTEPQELN
jgi:hypothetical protein